GQQPLAPAGEQDDRGVRRGRLDRGGDFATIDVGHAQIGDDDREGRAMRERCREAVDALLAPLSHRDDMAILLEDVAQGFDQHRIIVDQQNPMLIDRKSTRLNSSHVAISYAVFCLKKKNTKNNQIVIKTYASYVE